MIHPLDESWRSLLDAVAAEHRWPTTGEVSRVAAKVAALSAAYNDTGPSAPRAARAADALLARLLFSFPRDVAKGSGAVRELVATGALVAPGDRPLRVLDVGAGLGAMTWGLARALSADGHEGSIDATLLDDDGAALDLAQRIADKRADPRVRVRTLRRSHTEHAAAPGAFDVVLMGQVLSELDRELAPEARVAAHVAATASLLARLPEHGTLVLVEPALRERTRHLHALRDALLAAGHASVFAPCLHASPCPALGVPGDWCHEDLAVDLPAWLHPIARAAGLRWEGLTFSYLVLTKDARRLVSALPTGGVRLRVVSDRIVTKGKSEAFLCGEHGERPRIARLDRARAPENAAWDELRRGDLIAIAPSLERRVERDHHVVPIDVARLSR